MDGETLSVPVDHPAIPGHFPGRPIVPGVLLLDQLVEEWRNRRPDAPLRSLRKMKFVNMLKPGEPFSIAWEAVCNGRVAFTAHSGEKVLAKGQFELVRGA